MPTSYEYKLPNIPFYNFMIKLTLPLCFFIHPLSYNETAFNNLDMLFLQNNAYKLGMSMSSWLTGYSIERPSIEYYNRYSVNRMYIFLNISKFI